jgi:hypothetical protein
MIEHQIQHLLMLFIFYYKRLISTSKIISFVLFYLSYIQTHHHQPPEIENILK